MPIFQGYKSQTASRNLFTFVRVLGKTPKEAQTSQGKSKNTHEPTTNKIPAHLWKDAPITPGTLPRHKYRQTKFWATRFRFLWFWFWFCSVSVIFFFLAREKGKSFPGEGEEKGHACCLPLVWKETTLFWGDGASRSWWVGFTHLVKIYVDQKGVCES